MRSKVKVIGEKGHKGLEKASAAIAGVGGVGSILAEMLVRDGFTLRLIDKGRIEEQDVPRQSLYISEDITRFKAKQAKKRLESIIPNSTVKAFHEQILSNNIYLLKADVVFDCTQDTEITEMIAAQAKKDKTNFIAIRAHGVQYSILVSTKAITAKALEKLFTTNYKDEGILGITTHVAAAAAAAESYKILLGETKGTYLVQGNAWTGSRKVTNL